MNTFNFRNERIEYSYDWLDDDTFIFQFGEGRFIDEDDDEYFIHFEYHQDENEWVISVWWDDMNLNIVDVRNKDKYITSSEIEYVKDFAKKCME